MAKGQKIGELFFDIRAGIQSLQKDLTAGKSAISKFHGDVTKTFGNIGKALTLGAGIYGTVKAVQSFSNAMEELARKGDAASDILDNFKALGGSSSAIDGARKAVLGTVGAFELMAVANKGMLKNIPQINEHFEQMASFAKRFAESTGQDTVQVLGELTDALGKGATKGLAKFGFELDKGATKAQNIAAVWAQLPAVIERMAAPIDSVAEAQEALGVAWEDAQKKMGMGVNSNVQLMESYRNLETAISDVNLQQFGHDLATLQATLIELASKVLPSVVSWVESLSNAIEYFSVDTARSQLVHLGDAITDVSNKMAMLKNERDAIERPSRVGALVWGSQDEQKAAIQAEIDGLQKIQDKNLQIKEFLLNKTKEEQAAKDKMAADSVEKEKQRMLERQQLEQRLAGEAAAREQEAAAKKSKAVIDGLRKELAAFDTKSITEELDKAVTDGDSAAFTSLVEKYKESVVEGVIQGHQEALAMGGDVAQQVIDFADATAEMETDAYVAKFEEANTKRFEDERRKAEETNKASIDNWATLFDIAINGATFDLEAALKQVAVGFAAQMANAMVGNIGGIPNSPQGMGSMLAQMVLGQATSGAAGGAAGGGGMGAGMLEGMGLGSVLGSAGMTGAQASAAGIQGPAMANGMFASGSGVMGTIGPALPYIAAAVAAYYVADSFGVFDGGTKDPEAQARREFGGWMEEQVQKLKTISFYSPEGKLETQNAQNFDFKVGSDNRFNKPGWAEEMNAWGDDAKSTFSALGEALKEISGITEDVGGQIAYMLGTQLGGSVDNARLLVQQLGFSFEEMEEALFQMAKRGETNWQEYSINIAGLHNAFKPGLEAMGALSEAWDSFMESGGRGQAALTAGRNIGVEAMERGAETFDQAREMLIQAGKDPGAVNAYFDALLARGIKTFEELAAAEDKTLGAAIGDTGNNNAEISDKWKEATTAIEEYGSALEALPEEKVVKLKWESVIDGNTQSIIDSGVGGAAGLDIPSTTATGSSSVPTSGGVNARRLRGGGGSGINLHIDASGDGDAEVKVRRAVNSMQDKIVRQATRIVRENHRRNVYDD